MKDELKNKFAEYSIGKMSLDFKHFMVFGFAIMVLFGGRFIDTPKYQIIYAGFFATVLIGISVIYRLKRKWSWPGLSKTSIISLIFKCIFFYAVTTFTSYAINLNGDFSGFKYPGFMALVESSWEMILLAASNPMFTPIFLMMVGIVFVHILLSLNLMTGTKDKFDSQCQIDV